MKRAPPTKPLARKYGVGSFSTVPISYAVVALVVIGIAVWIGTLTDRDETMTPQATESELHVRSSIAPPRILVVKRH